MVPVAPAALARCAIAPAGSVTAASAAPRARPSTTRRDLTSTPLMMSSFACHKSAYPCTPIPLLIHVRPGANLESAAPFGDETLPDRRPVPSDSLRLLPVPRPGATRLYHPPFHWSPPCPADAGNRP